MEWGRGKKNPVTFEIEWKVSDKLKICHLEQKRHEVNIGWNSSPSIWLPEEAFYGLQLL